MSCNYYEKLYRSEYDTELKEEDLTIGDRIISISDIFYDLTEKILFDMVNNNYIEKSIVKIVIENYEEVDKTKKDYQKR